MPIPGGDITGSEIWTTATQPVEELEQEVLPEETQEAELTEDCG